ncbi:conjugal transfer protein TraX [Salmonella enterica]|nr:conjugal transfer protein TraX [Salmonella enterica]EEI9343012.1 conjugal transfer protein TraX [Salmonella enterica subsp. enterica serovar Hvittingfoss]EHI4845742.1 conjugal transfer protein TraX [Salmonella enterica]HEC6701041.1 conjugal transfer protein TraX [Salmonella enterica subsp. enterica serovar Weltevreden]HEC6915042.1 conjugal transfer protein TraX [Salmonella enterica subsp. enterica serovar Weltevreden]
MSNHRINPAPMFPVALNPAALDVVKLVALIAMFVDHANTLFMTKPDPLLYAVGRMAFPLFTLIWAMNVQRTPERLQKRANRLWLWAFITQPVFSLAFRHHEPWYALNILFVFASVTQLLALKYRYGKKGVISGVLLLALMVWPLQPASYGLAGIMLAAGLVLVYSGPTYRIYRIGIIVSLLSLCSLNGISHILNQPADILLFATLPTLFLPMIIVSLAVSLCSGKCSRLMPPRFFYFAYAGHLLVAIIIS